MLAKFYSFCGVRYFDAILCIQSRRLVKNHTLKCKKCMYEVEVNLRPTVSRPVCPGVRHPSETRDQFFSLLEISYRQLRLCYFVVPSLMRGRVCNLLEQLILGLARAVTPGSECHRTHGHILLSHLRLPNLEDQVPVFISPRNRVAQLYPRALGSLFVVSYDSQGLRWRYSNPPPHGLLYICVYGCSRQSGLQDYNRTRKKSISWKDMKHYWIFYEPDIKSK
jgi:hypothetical protein